MWHEARKHEKKIRVMIVDYRRRAERRREFYEKFKADPAQFIQIHGRPCKIYMDSQITAAADNSLMPWQGNKDITIDRFDVRAHLDYIPEVGSSNSEQTQEMAPDETEDSNLNYERYRILIQNDLAGISEDKFLHQIHLEEQFGNTAPHASKSFESKSKLPKAAIAYSYEDSTPGGNTSAKSTSKAFPLGENAEEDSDEDVDFDLLLNVNDLTIVQKAELNNNGTKYGLAAGEFMTYLNTDAQERDDIRMAKLEAEEKLTMSGRKARRERRAFKDKVIIRKGLLSPPSYAAAPEEEGRRSSSRSASRSGSNSPEKVTFITSFGEPGADRNTSKAEIGPSLPPGGLPRQIRRKWNRSKSRSRSPNVRKMASKARSRSRSRSRLRDNRRGRNGRNSRDGRRFSRSRSGSPRTGRSGHSGRIHNRRRSQSSSSSHSRSDRRRRRSSSRSRYQRRRRTRSRSRSRSTSATRSSRRARSNRSRDRSRSRERNVSRNKRTSKSRRSRSRSTSRKRSSRKSISPKRNTSSSPPKKSSTSSRRRKSRSSSSSSDTSSSSPSPKRSSSVQKPENKGGNEVGSKPNGSSLPQKSDHVSTIKLPSPPPVRRYYGRQNKEKNNSDSNSSDDTSSSDDAFDNESAKNSTKHNRDAHKFSTSTSHFAASKSKPSVSTGSKSVCSTPVQDGSSASSSGPKLTPQERLKRRMQSALNKQLRADKEAEKTRIERLEQERMDREDTLRELSIKYRRRERERRHNNAATSGSSNESNSNNSSPDNRSRSGSPCMEMEM